MAEGVNVRFKGDLKRFVETRVDESAGLYGSSSEYIRDLVRRDYQREEARKWAWLRHELETGASAAESAFVALDADTIIASAKARRQANAG
ncbi:MAG: antitoxin ParD1/3/4 [Candidatus Azotimanducaceae bacterium]|jgi:antitoxin ParD1/3/4